MAPSGSREVGSEAGVLVLIPVLGKLETDLLFQYSKDFSPSMLTAMCFR